MDATSQAANPAVNVGSGAETAQCEIIRYQHENAMSLMNLPVNFLIVILVRMRGAMLMFRPRRADTGIWSAECWRTPTTFGGTRLWLSPTDLERRGWALQSVRTMKPCAPYLALFIR